LNITDTLIFARILRYFCCLSTPLFTGLQWNITF